MMEQLLFINFSVFFADSGQRFNVEGCVADFRLHDMIDRGQGVLNYSRWRTTS
jgi:hypothetical protein